MLQTAVRKFLLGDRRTIAGTVYGTIVVLAVLAAGAKSYQHQLWRLGVIAGMSSLVLWLAHVYSHGLGESVSLGRRLTVAELRAIARREYSVLLAALPPVLMIELGAAGVVGTHVAVWLALGVGVITLAAQGVRYARLEQLSTAGTITTIAINLGLGLTLVALEVLVTH
jgi:hypothetical protein